MDKGIKFKREIEFSPAYDKRDPNPSKNYGIHGVDMRWYLRGPKGTIQFVVFTNWYLPHVQKELEYEANRLVPMPADLGYHSFKPMYEQQTRMECHLLKGGHCYYDGSGLNAEPVFELLLKEGGEAVWKRLEEEYHARFTNG